MPLQLLAEKTRQALGVGSPQFQPISLERYSQTVGEAARYASWLEKVVHDIQEAQQAVTRFFAASLAALPDCPLPSLYSERYDNHELHPIPSPPPPAQYAHLFTLPAAAAGAALMRGMQPDATAPPVGQTPAAAAAAGPASPGQSSSSLHETSRPADCAALQQRQTSPAQPETRKGAACSPQGPAGAAPTPSVQSFSRLSAAMEQLPTDCRLAVQLQLLAPMEVWLQAYKEAQSRMATLDRLRLKVDAARRKLERKGKAFLSQQAKLHEQQRSSTQHSPSSTPLHQQQQQAAADAEQTVAAAAAAINRDTAAVLPVPPATGSTSQPPSGSTIPAAPVLSKVASGRSESSGSPSLPPTLDSGTRPNESASELSERVGGEDEELYEAVFTANGEKGLLAAHEMVEHRLQPLLREFQDAELSLSMLLGWLVTQAARLRAAIAAVLVDAAAAVEVWQLPSGLLEPLPLGAAGLGKVPPTKLPAGPIAEGKLSFMKPSTTAASGLDRQQLLQLQQQMSTGPSLGPDFTTAGSSSSMGQPSGSSSLRIGTTPTLQQQQRQGTAVSPDTTDADGGSSSLRLGTEASLQQQQQRQTDTAMSSDIITAAGGSSSSSKTGRPKLAGEFLIRKSFEDELRREAMQEQRELEEEQARCNMSMQQHGNDLALGAIQEYYRSGSGLSTDSSTPGSGNSTNNNTTNRNSISRTPGRSVAWAPGVGVMPADVSAAAAASVGAVAGPAVVDSSRSNSRRSSRLSGSSSGSSSDIAAVPQSSDKADAAPVATAQGLPANRTTSRSGAAAAAGGSSQDRAGVDSHLDAPAHVPTVPGAVPGAIPAAAAAHAASGLSLTPDRSTFTTLDMQAVAEEAAAAAIDEATGGQQQQQAADGAASDMNTVPSAAAAAVPTQTTPPEAAAAAAEPVSTDVMAAVAGAAAAGDDVTGGASMPVPVGGKGLAVSVYKQALQLKLAQPTPTLDAAPAAATQPAAAAAAAASRGAEKTDLPPPEAAPDTEAAAAACALGDSDAQQLSRQAELDAAPQSGPPPPPAAAAAASPSTRGPSSSSSSSSSSSAFAGANPGLSSPVSPTVAAAAAAAPQAGVPLHQQLSLDLSYFTRDRTLLAGITGPQDTCAGCSADPTSQSLVDQEQQQLLARAAELEAECDTFNAAAAEAGRVAAAAEARLTQLEQQLQTEVLAKRQQLLQKQQAVSAGLTLLLSEISTLDKRYTECSSSSTALEAERQHIRQQIEQVEQQQREAESALNAANAAAAQVAAAQNQALVRKDGAQLQIEQCQASLGRLADEVSAATAALSAAEAAAEQARQRLAQTQQELDIVSEDVADAHAQQTSSTVQLAELSRLKRPPPPAAAQGRQLSEVKQAADQVQQQLQQARLQEQEHSQAKQHLQDRSSDVSAGLAALEAEAHTLACQAAALHAQAAGAEGVTTAETARAAAAAAEAKGLQAAATTLWRATPQATVATDPMQPDTTTGSSSSTGMSRAAAVGAATAAAGAPMTSDAMAARDAAATTAAPTATDAAAAAAAEVEGSRTAPSSAGVTAAAPAAAAAAAGVTETTPAAGVTAAATPDDAIPTGEQQQQQQAALEAEYRAALREQEGGFFAKLAQQASATAAAAKLLLAGRKHTTADTAAFQQQQQQPAVLPTAGTPTAAATPLQTPAAAVEPAARPPAAATPPPAAATAAVVPEEVVQELTAPTPPAPPSHDKELAAIASAACAAELAGDTQLAAAAAAAREQQAKSVGAEHGISDEAARRVVGLPATGLSAEQREGTAAESQPETAGSVTGSVEEIRDVTAAAFDGTATAEAGDGTGGTAGATSSSSAGADTEVVEVDQARQQAALAAAAAAAAAESPRLKPTAVAAAGRTGGSSLGGDVIELDAQPAPVKKVTLMLAGPLGGAEDAGAVQVQGILVGRQRQQQQHQRSQRWQQQVLERRSSSSSAVGRRTTSGDADGTPAAAAVTAEQQQQQQQRARASDATYIPHTEQRRRVVLDLAGPLGGDSDAGKVAVHGVVVEPAPGQQQQLWEQRQVHRRLSSKHRQQLHSWKEAASLLMPLGGAPEDQGTLPAQLHQYADYSPALRRAPAEGVQGLPRPSAGAGVPKLPTLEQQQYSVGQQQLQQQQYSVAQQQQYGIGQPGPASNVGGSSSFQVADDKMPSPFALGPMGSGAGGANWGGAEYRSPQRTLSGSYTHPDLLPYRSASMASSSSTRGDHHHRHPAAQHVDSPLPLTYHTGSAQLSPPPASTTVSSVTSVGHATHTPKAVQWLDKDRQQNQQQQQLVAAKYGRSVAAAGGHGAVYGQRPIAAAAAPAGPESEDDVRQQQLQQLAGPLASGGFGRPGSRRKYSSRRWM